jgi:putative Holliday junction resolvase
MSAATGPEAQTTVASPAAATLTEQAVAPVPVAAAATPAPRKSMGPSANLAGPVDVPARHQLFLAFDYGVKRTGVASGNRITQSASPLATIQASGEAQLLAVVKRVKEWQPDALVVGIPFHPDGVAHQNTKRARQFANQLRTRTKLVVYEVDERYSTTEAHSMGAADADAASACIILEQFLRSLP